MASEATPFDTSVTFLFAPGCSTTFEGLPEGGEPCWGCSSQDLPHREGCLSWSYLKRRHEWLGGSRHFLRAWLRASSYTWAQ